MYSVTTKHIHIIYIYTAFIKKEFYQQFSLKSNLRTSKSKATWHFKKAFNLLSSLSYINLNAMRIFKVSDNSIHSSQRKELLILLIARTGTGTRISSSYHNLEGD